MDSAVEVIESDQKPGSSGGGVGDATRPNPDRFAWLEAAAFHGGWQFGEQGVIDEIFSVIGTATKYCVEFGAGDGKGLPLATRRLIDGGWKALLIEGDTQSCAHLREQFPSSTVVNAMVGTKGDGKIDAILAANKSPKTPDFMVIDVDSIDYYIWKSMIEYAPRVVMIEHCDLIYEGPEADAKTPMPMSTCGTVIPNSGGFIAQVSGRCLDKLGKDKGYVCVFRTRVNSIFVRQKDAEKLVRPMVRLNVGSGSIQIPGYTNVDIKEGVDARKLPYPDNSVDEVYASHLLEHFDYATEVDAVLAEWVRVLRPGGLLRIAVPDVDKYIKDRSTLNSFVLDRYFLGGHKDENDRHGSVFDETKLKQCMGKAGIGGIQRFESFTKDCSSLPISLNLDGRKRWVKPLDKPRVCLVLSQPRVAFTGHESCLLKLAHKLQFDVEFSKGAFWDRDMTISTQLAISKYNPDIILYSDFDSIFSPEDAIKLIDSLNNDPTAAVKGVVQMERHGDKPLVMDVKLDYSGDETQVRFQHFGLTAVRTHVFTELPLPWFWSIPGSNGDWTLWNRSDADITFWRMLREYGLKVYQHNDIVIGHIINAIKWPKIDGSGVLLQPEDAYHVNGRPAKAGFNADCYRPKPTEPVKNG